MQTPTQSTPVPHSTPVPNIILSLVRVAELKRSPPINRGEGKVSGDIIPERTLKDFLLHFTSSLDNLLLPNFTQNLSWFLLPSYLITLLFFLKLGSFTYLTLNNTVIRAHTLTVSVHDRFTAPTSFSYTQRSGKCPEVKIDRWKQETSCCLPQEPGEHQILCLLVRIRKA